MGNLSHTIGGTDNLVSFKSAARVPIDSLKVHFKPIQEGEGDPSPENVRPIRGWNEVEAYKSGKNIARVTGYSAINTINADVHSTLSNKYGTTISTNNYNLPDSSVIITQTQAPNETNPSSYNNGYFAVMVNNLIYGCNYDISFKITNITNNILNANLNSIRLISPVGYARVPIIINDNILIFKNMKWERYSEDPTNFSYNRSNFEIRNCGISFTLSEFMVTPVGMNDGVFEPYCGEVIPVTFPPEAGTIYGGYVDLVKGEVVAEWVKFTKKLSDYTSKTEYDDIIFYDFQPLSNLSCLASPNDETISRNNSKCSIALHRWATQSSKINHYYIYRLNNDSTRLLLYLMPSSVESEDVEFELAFRLKDPIHYPLTSTQLKTFLNNNTFWSNTNDVTEVSYAVHDSVSIRDARKRIVAASPKLETMNDVMVTFNTDVKAPLKGCKIEFKPIQDLHGQAVPSPVAGKNLLNVCLDNKWGTETNTGCIGEKGTGFVIPAGYSTNGGFWMPCEPNTTYTYSFSSTYTGANMHGRVWEFSEKTTSRSLPLEALIVNTPRWPGSETFTTGADSHWLLVGLYNNTSSGGFTVTNMQVEKGDAVTSYEPFKGIFPISGTDSISVFSTNKNLLPPGPWETTSCGVTFTYSEDGSLHVEGTASDGTAYLGVPQSMIFTIAPGNYTLSGNYDGSDLLLYINNSVKHGGDIKFLDSGYGKTRELYYTDDQCRLQCAVVKGKTVNTTIYPQLEKGESATNFICGNVHESCTIELPETMYGGYVDLIKGKLIQEWIQVKINSLSWTYMNSGECFRSSVPMERVGYKEISPVRSSIYETLIVGSTISSWADKEDYSISEHIGNSGDTLIQSIHIKDSRYTTVNDFLNGVGNENIVYKLLTPIEYDIDPQILKTLRGTNNIWSTSNGPITIKYWKH